MVDVIEAVTSYDWFHPGEIDAAKSGRDLEGVQPQQNAMKQRLVGIEREVRRAFKDYPHHLRHCDALTWGSTHQHHGQA